MSIVRTRKRLFRKGWDAKVAWIDFSHPGPTEVDAVKGLKLMLELGAKRCDEWLKEHDK